MNAHNYIKKIAVLIICGIGSAPALSANTVTFSGADFNFSVSVTGEFRVLQKDDKINQMLTKFVQTKGDIATLRGFYDDDSKARFDSMMADEKSKSGFLRWFEGLKAIRARAVIKKGVGHPSTVFLHINEGMSAQIVMQAEITNEEMDPKLVFSNISYPKGGSPHYWIVQFWNAMPALDPKISENIINK